MKQKKCQKMPKKFICQLCDFSCSKKSNYESHLMTAKHKMKQNETNFTPKNALPNMHSCDICDAEFNSRTSLWRHKKKCQIVLENEINDNNKPNMQLEEDEITTRELVTQLIEVMKTSGNTYNTTNNTTNNNNFNLNFFLNTTCKDAMNMSEFIENIEVDFKDIENIGRNGYVAGMTDMIVSRIKDLDVTKRPLHCTDLKRETLYIKENDEWSKDTPEKTRLRHLMDCVGRQNYSKIPEWREEYPECQISDTPKYDLCMDMMLHTLGDVGEAQIKLDNKVIKNISKEILVDKMQKN